MAFERETIINFCEGGIEADIYTHSEKWINRLEKIGIKPYAVNDKGGKSYKIPKSYLKLPRAKRIMSEEKRKVMSDRMTERLKTMKRVGRPKKQTGSV
jgi:hypothetical protein